MFELVSIAGLTLLAAALRKARRNRRKALFAYELVERIEELRCQVRFFGGRP